ncbi:uncharacterized protein LOC129293034 [Prosopis cineraria]|uniref:uncharacterized protein LOC129293034 n=1 Tax=Prosopis cineraria TaxID=364024 RepID=UPI00240F22D7|nr:uncharacterized protein LOC129293034 [Prosopis cineraria]
MDSGAYCCQRSYISVRQPAEGNMNIENDIQGNLKRIYARMKPADAEPETSLRSPRNNALLMRLRCNYFNPIFNPPIQPSFHDSNQKLNFQKDAEKPTEDLPGKVVKKRKFPFADETAADANVNCCLRNMEATAKFSSLSMKIGEEREVKNKETTKFSVVLISDKI